MKKRSLFSLVALATLTLGSCTNDEVVNDYSQGNAIQFGTYVGRNAESRASEYTENSMAQTGFGVYAYHSVGKYTETDFQANFMNNQKVETTWTENDATDKKDYVWTYSPLKYWPNNPDDYVSFVAYAPYSESSSEDNISFGNDLSKLEFTVNNDVMSQTDLVWSKTKNLNMQKPDIESKVMFEFAHALSRIGFKISAAVDETTKGEGDLDAKTTIYVDKVELSENFAKSGTLDLTAATASWTLGSEFQGFVLDYIHNSDATTELQNNILKGSDEDAESEKQLNKDNSYLMIIPNETDFSLTVTYRVFTEDSSLTGTVVEQEGVKGSLVTNVITVPLTDIDFQAGNAYTFNIILGMTSVKVDVDVASWNVVDATDHWFNENKEASEGE